MRWAIGTRTSPRPATGKFATCSEGRRDREVPAPIPGGGVGFPGRPVVIGREGTTRSAPCGAAARRTSVRLPLPAQVATRRVDLAVAELRALMDRLASSPSPL